VKAASGTASARAARRSVLSADANALMCFYSQYIKKKLQLKASERAILKAQSSAIIIIA
jgi:hypothetical protein